MKISTIGLGLVLVTSLVACPPPPPSCVLFLTPSTMSLRPGQSNGFDVSASSTCSFTGTVSLSIDNPTSYPFSVSFNPQSGSSATSRGTVSVPVGTPFNTYTVTVRATVGANSITSGLQVTVLQ